MLEIKDLSVVFNSREEEINVVKNVYLEINRGEILAIVGESGSGKTTLGRAILQILPKNGEIKNGEIIFEDKDIVKLTQRDMESIRGKEISMIFQNPMTALNPTISIGNQILEAIRVHNKFSKKEAKKEAIKLMKLVKIEDAERRFGEYPHQFSGGMRQRIVIAIALSCNPKILIADEPTTSLDATIQNEILDLLLGLQKRIGLSILFITHDLGVVAKVADRVAIMHKGCIVEMGSIEKVFYNAEHSYAKRLLSTIEKLQKGECC